MIPDREADSHTLPCLGSCLANSSFAARSFPRLHLDSPGRSFVRCSCAGGGFRDVVHGPRRDRAGLSVTPVGHEAAFRAGNATRVARATRASGPAQGNLAAENLW